MISIHERLSYNMWVEKTGKGGHLKKNRIFIGETGLCSLASLSLLLLSEVSNAIHSREHCHMIDFPYPSMTSWFVCEHLLHHSHQMRMRLANGSDIALHSIMATIEATKQSGLH